MRRSPRRSFLSSLASPEATPDQAGLQPGKISIGADQAAQTAWAGRQAGRLRRRADPFIGEGRDLGPHDLHLAQENVGSSGSDARKQSEKGADPARLAVAFVAEAPKVATPVVDQQARAATKLSRSPLIEPAVVASTQGVDALLPRRAQHLLGRPISRPKELARGGNGYFGRNRRAQEAGENKELVKRRRPVGQPDPRLLGIRLTEAVDQVAGAFLLSRGCHHSYVPSRSHMQTLGPGYIIAMDISSGAGS